MDTDQPKKKGNALKIVLGFLVVVIIFGFYESSQTSTPQPLKPSYDAIARAHFDEVLKASPELSGIACENNDCSSSVVYFDFKTIPDDYDTVLRGNAATYSKLGLDNQSISHVTVAGRFNGNVFYACSAADGVVKDCGKYKN